MADISKIFQKAEKNVKKLTGREFLDIEAIYRKYGIPGYISTGLPGLDLRLMHNRERTEYGIPRGRIVEFHGEKSSFKSTFCYRVAAQVIEEGGRVYWISTELDFDRDYAIDILVEDYGIPYDRVVENFKVAVAKTTTEIFETMNGLMEILTEGADEMDKVGKNPLEEFPPIIFILDSLASALSGTDYERYEKEFDDGPQVGATARDQHNIFRFFLEPLARIGATFLYTNQYRANLGYGYSNRKVAHEAAVRYYATLRVGMNAYDHKIQSSNPTRKGVSYKFGQRINFKIYKIRGELVADGETDIIYQFNHGFDYYKSVIDVLQVCGITELSRGEYEIEEEEGIFAELNGKYNERELKEKLNEDPARAVEYAYEAMRLGPLTLEDMRMK